MFSMLIYVLYILLSLPVLQVLCRMFDCLHGAPQVEVGLPAWSGVVTPKVCSNKSFDVWRRNKIRQRGLMLKQDVFYSVVIFISVLECTTFEYTVTSLIKTVKKEIQTGA